MKKVLTVVLLGCLATLEVACSSSVKYRYDYDQMVEFRRYRRYAWMPAPKQASGEMRVDTINDRRIKQAVNVELLKRGMQIVDSQPDLYVAYHLGAPGMTNPNYTGDSYGGGELAMAEVGSGAFVLDMIDAKTNELIWRGIASGAYDAKDTDPEKIQKSVNKIVDNLLKKYPPDRS